MRTVVRRVAGGRTPARVRRPVPLRSHVRHHRHTRDPPAPAARGRVQPRAVSAHPCPGREHSVVADDRRRRRGARCAHARTRRGLDCARVRRRGSGRRRRTRPRDRPAGSSRLHPAPALADGGGSEAVLRGLRERGAVAAVPRGARSAHLPQAGLGALPAGQRPVRRRHRGGASGPVGARLHSGLPSRARRREAPPPSAGGEDGHLLAHPVAERRSAPHLSLAARDPGRPHRERSHRLSARSRPPQLPGRGPRERPRGDAQHRPHGQPDRGGQGGADRRRLRPHPADHAGSGSRGGAGRACGRSSGSTRR